MLLQVHLVQLGTGASSLLAVGGLFASHVPLSSAEQTHSHDICCLNGVYIVKSLCWEVFFLLRF